MNLLIYISACQNLLNPEITIFAFMIYIPGIIYFPEEI